MGVLWHGQALQFSRHTRARGWCESLTGPAEAGTRSATARVALTGTTQINRRGAPRGRVGRRLIARTGARTGCPPWDARGVVGCSASACKSRDSAPTRIRKKPPWTDWRSRVRISAPRLMSPADGGVCPQRPCRKTLSVDAKTIAIIVGLGAVGLVARYADSLARRRRREARLERQREYGRYLKSPEWGQRRGAIVQRSRGFCEGLWKPREPRCSPPDVQAARERAAG
jgi:hypothetical protein